nr:LLM class flavin-dependent oxidoreductase [Pseudonocardia broussonetiae]
MVKTWIFDIFNYPHDPRPEMFDPAKCAELYDWHLESWLRADEQAFDGIFFSEHHFTAYNVSPSPNLLVATVARLTKRVRLGVMANIVPFHDPRPARRGSRDARLPHRRAPRGRIGSRRRRAGVPALEAHIAAALDAHADQAVFTSLPRSGTVRAATLLAEIGDVRARFPTDDALAAAAGIAPSTRASGRAHYVTFRRGCNHRLRQAVVDFADGSRAAHPWAQDTYTRARGRGLNHAHAVRVLARAWLRIIWRCWNDHTPYDQARHLAAVAARHPQTGTPKPAPMAS